MLIAVRWLMAALVGCGALCAAEAMPERISLWTGHAPDATHPQGAADAWLTLHRSPVANSAVMVICPGGGYGGLVTGAEGHGIAAWLNAHGIAGAVLEYRLPKGEPLLPLRDAQRAVRLLRAQAASYGIDPTRVGIIGFSAGGHLAATLSTHFDAGEPNAADPIERQSCRPDLTVLVYPVITMGAKTHLGSRNNLLGEHPTPEQVAQYSAEERVTAATPPAFLTHAKDDSLVSVDNSRAYAEALRAHGVPVEYLELPSGGHGLNHYQGPMWDAWQTASLAWLVQQKFTAEPPQR